MATRGYVGYADHNNPGQLHVRFVLYAGKPADMLSVVSDIRRCTFAGDTTATLAAILAHDWVYLSADITAGHTGGMRGDLAVPGVGIAMTEDTVTTVDADPDPDAGARPGPAPVTFATLANSDAEWVYLIDPHEPTVAVHTPSGDPITVHPIPA